MLRHHYIIKRFLADHHPCKIYNIPIPSLSFTIHVVDEIEKVKGWSSIVKLHRDEDSRLTVTLKVIFTGSSSLLLQKGLADSPMGRFKIFYYPHWYYAELKDALGYSLDDFYIKRIRIPTS